MPSSQLELIATGIWSGETQVTNEELAERDFFKYLTDGTQNGEAKKTPSQEIYKRLGVLTRPIANTKNHTQMFNCAFDQALQDASQRGFTDVKGNIFALFAGSSEDQKRIPNFLHDICDNAGMHPNHHREFISQACSSFNNSVTRLNEYLQQNQKTEGYALVGAAEIFRSLWRPDNFDSALFGDLAGVALFKVALSPDDSVKKQGVIGCINKHTPDIEGAIIRRDDGYLYMNGTRVQRFAPIAMIETCRESLARANLTPQQIDLFVFHAGSAHVYSTLRRGIDRLVDRKLPDEMIPQYLENFGNTGAVTTLNAIHQERIAGKIKPEMKIYVGSIGMGFYESGFILQT